MENKRSADSTLSLETGEASAPAISALIGVADSTPTSAAIARDVVWETPYLGYVLALTAVMALFLFYVGSHVWQCDDAFISYRYVRNLVMGHGLVFNVGERVEGYTNFLWVLELAAIWKTLGVPPEHSNYALSALCTIGTLLVTARLALRTPFTHERWIAVVITLFFLTINRNFVVWTTSGLETRQFTFLVISAMWLMQRAPVLKPYQRYVPASLLWSAAELTRPEGALLFACAGAWLFSESARRRQVRPWELAGFVLPFAIIVGLHLVFRYTYYGDIVPNTFRAKYVRPWPEAGFMYMAAAVIEAGVYAAAPVAALGMLARLALSRDSVHVLSAFCISVHAAYLIRLGGDHFEFRPLDFYWPLLSVAVADGLLLLQAVLRRWFAAATARHAEIISWFGVATLALVLTVYGTIFQLAHISLTHDLKHSFQTLRIGVEITEERFPAAFLLPGVASLATTYNFAIRDTAKHFIGTRHGEHKAFWQSQMEKFGPYVGKIDGLFPPSAVVKLAAVGVAPYSMPELTVIDRHGLTDRTIARTAVSTANQDRQLAHERTPPKGYLASRGVNLEVFGAARHFGTASEYAIRLDGGVWMPIATTAPEWLRTAFAGKRFWWKLLSPALTENQVIAEGKLLRPHRALGFFDTQDSEGWSSDGNNMILDSVEKLPQVARPSGYVGSGLVDSFDAVKSGQTTGSLFSPLFNPHAGDHLAFLVGGGRTAKVGVELRVSGRSVATWRGLDSNELGLVAKDLTAYAGKSCRVRIYDDATGPWGHVVADHFMLLR